MNMYTEDDPEATSNRIRELNDAFRTTLKGGTLLITAGIVALGADYQAKIIEGVRSFTAFTPDNDPYGEHDFGSINVAREQIFFKIDYYDKTKAAHSADAADPEVTERVLTIMLAGEW
jgi:Protein of unknown function (DUF3768)